MHEIQQNLIGFHTFRTSQGKNSPIRIVESTLRIRSLEVLDKGFYTCEVSGGGGSSKKISSTAILNVIHDPGKHYVCTYNKLPNLWSWNYLIKDTDTWYLSPCYTNPETLVNNYVRTKVRNVTHVHIVMKSADKPILILHQKWKELHAFFSLTRLNVCHMDKDLLSSITSYYHDFSQFGHPD